MRYEVRIYNLEEMLPENRMTYAPYNNYDDARDAYAEALESYNDNNHEVELCVVTYLPWGENVRVLASTRNPDPKHIIVEEDWI